MADAIPAKSSQEVEIDHLLAEEFLCDPAFVARFLTVCNLPCKGLRVIATTAEPSLGGDGFGDLLVEGRTPDDRKVALLIEDKITAGPATRQAERYAAFVGLLRRKDFDEVWTVLVSPASYQGERKLYDTAVSLETVATIIESPDCSRQTHRRGIIERALVKKATTGVRVPDPALRRLKEAYLRHAALWCTQEECAFNFPELRENYSAVDSWIEKISHPAFPPNVKLRHRLWTNIKDRCGLVDLIISPATAAERQSIGKHVPTGAVVYSYSEGKGVQVSMAVAELRQHVEFDENVATRAFECMKRLVAWYQAERLSL